MLAASALALAACKGSIISTDRTRLTAADSSITGPCARPVRLPERKLSQADVEKYWSRDRANLVRCAGEKAEVVRYYDDLFRRIGKDR